MKLLVINNIVAGIGDGSIYDYLRMVSRDGDEHAFRCTDGTTAIDELLYDADQFDAVVVAGGDGTLAGASHILANTGIPILPFPAGTANLLANNLLSPYEPFALAKMTRAMNTLDFDLGVIEAHGETFGFNIMAGAGYDATIMHDALPAKKLLGPVAYFQAAFANTQPQLSKISLNIDGKSIESEGLGVLLVNFSRIQFEIPVTHNADARDGSLDVVVLKAQNAFELIPALMAGVRDRDGAYPSRSSSVEVFRGHRVEVAADPPFQIQYDGELPELATPFSAYVLEGATRFILSDAGYDHFCTKADDGLKN